MTLLLKLNVAIVCLFLIKAGNTADPVATLQAKQTLKQVDNFATSKTVNSSVSCDHGNQAALLKIALLVLELASKQETECNIKCHKGDGSQCRDGFTLLGQKCYHVISKALTWQEASDACRNHGGATLAEPTTAEEDRLLTDYLRANFPIERGGATQIWIGGTDVDSPGSWVWASTKAKVQRTNWAPGEPNSRNKDHCMAYMASGASIMWNDAPCHTKLRSVCQQ